ncbi:MAG: type II toxin-antitoxin system RelE/ParE family toxin [Bacteroides sp.]|nr:type II toxin-antitoxin system RelE/ParE family toxin [Bacteroides sp.]
MTEYEYTLGFLSGVTNDMAEIVSAFMMLKNKKGAIRIKNNLLKAADRIRTIPYSGIVAPDEKMAAMGFRMMIVEDHMMFYRVFEDEKNVLVYRILNGKRDYPSIVKKFDIE